MKPSLKTPGALPKYFLAAMLLPALPVFSQTIPNPSFEDPATFSIFPGYVSDNGPIPGWTGAPTNRIGLNPAGAATPFADNGQIPNGTKVAFLQGSTAGPTTLQTTITGLTPGTKYHVSFRSTARSNNPAAGDVGNMPFLTFSTDGTGLAVSAQVQRVQPNNVTPKVDYHYMGYDFTATAASHVMTLTNAKGADHTVVVDHFEIAPSTNSWAMLPWTGDDLALFDSSYNYTHAYNFNGGVLNINGVPFINMGTAAHPGFLTVTGLNAAHGGPGTNLVTGTSKTLAQAFLYGGGSSITIRNLKPNTQYVASIYGLGFDLQTPNAYHRTTTFSSSLGGERYTANLNQFGGQGTGSVLEYRYTTDALGTPVTISYEAMSNLAGNYHTAGFSNREAVVAPAPELWTAKPWTNDADSEVSSYHPYTHAVKFGAAANTNVNGVNFTGYAGANPTAGNFNTGGLANVFAGDINEVTGTSAVLAKDFLYGGFPENINLLGLTPGKTYVFTLYSVGWNDGLREGLFSGPGTMRNKLDQFTYGDNKGVRFEYTYTAPASGTANISFFGKDGAKSIHAYGFSNRETDPYVDKAPEITAQPVGTTIGSGLSYTLRVGVLGSPTMSYVWKRGTEVVSGANGPSLLLENVDATDAGDYTVEITNEDGTATSSVATVIVRENAPGRFSTGIGPDGLPLAGGQIDPNFKIIANPDNPDSEVAYVQTNIPGAWIANTATSKWIGPRADTVGAAGAPAADGEAPGTYVYRMSLDLTNFDLSTVEVSGRWAADNGGTEIRVNGVSVGFPATTPPTFGTYVPFNINNTAFPGRLTNGLNTIDFVVNNETVGFAGLRLDNFQAIGLLPPNTPPHIGIQPLSTTGPHNQTVVLGVGASGTSPLSYQWYEDTTPIPDATLPYLYLPIDDLNSGGNFKVRVTNTTNFVESNVAVVTVNNAVPVAVADLFDTELDAPLVLLTSVDLLGNDTDADGDSLALASFSAASTAGGTVTQDGDELTYTPPVGFEGVDTFTYTVNDGVWGGVSTSGTVTIVVGDPSAAPPANLAVTMEGGGIVANFTGSPGSSYTLQRSDDLDGWDDIDTDTASPEGAVQLTDPNPLPIRGFYRVSYFVAPAP